MRLRVTRQKSGKVIIDKHFKIAKNTKMFMIDYENLRRQITEERCFDNSKFNTPFVIISENNTEIFTFISQN